MFTNIYNIHDFIYKTNQAYEIATIQIRQRK